MLTFQAHRAEQNRRGSRRGAGKTLRREGGLSDLIKVLFPNSFGALPNVLIPIEGTPAAKMIDLTNLFCLSMTCLIRRPFVQPSATQIALPAAALLLKILHISAQRIVLRNWR